MLLFNLMPYNDNSFSILYSNTILSSSQFELSSIYLYKKQDSVFTNAAAKSDIFLQQILIISYL